MALVVESWKKVKVIENYQDVAGELLFRRYVICWCVCLSLLLLLQRSLNKRQKVSSKERESSRERDTLYFSPFSLSDTLVCSLLVLSLSLLLLLLCQFGWLCVCVCVSVCVGIIIMMNRIFEIAPGARALFAFATADAADDDEMYKSQVYLKHSRGVIGMVDAAVGLLEAGDMTTLVTVLKDLGAKHVSYGVQDVHYPVVGQALLDTLDKALGTEFTPDVKDAWAGVYGVITENMLAGAKELCD
jgi:hypothetical protein